MPDTETIQPTDIVRLNLKSPAPAIYVGPNRTQTYRQDGWVTFEEVPLMEGHANIRQKYPFISALHGMTSVTPPIKDANGKLTGIIPMQPSPKPGLFMYGQFDMMSHLTPFIFLNSAQRPNWAASKCLDKFMWLILNDPAFTRMLTEFGREIQGKSEAEMPTILQKKIESYFARQQ